MMVGGLRPGGRGRKATHYLLILCTQLVDHLSEVVDLLLERVGVFIMIQPNASRSRIDHGYEWQQLNLSDRKLSIPTDGAKLLMYKNGLSIRAPSFRCSCKTTSNDWGRSQSTTL